MENKNDFYQNIMQDGYFPPHLQKAILPLAPAPEPIVKEDPKVMESFIPNMVNNSNVAAKEEAPVRFKQVVDTPDLPKDPPRKLDLGHDSAGNEITPESAGIKR